MILLSELERRALIKLVSNVDEGIVVCDGNDRRVLHSPVDINRTVALLVAPSIHRWIRIRPIRLNKHRSELPFGMQRISRAYLVRGVFGGIELSYVKDNDDCTEGMRDSVGDSVCSIGGTGTRVERSIFWRVFLVYGLLIRRFPALRKKVRSIETVDTILHTCERICATSSSRSFAALWNITCGIIHRHQRRCFLSRLNHWFLNGGRHWFRWWCDT